MSQRTAPKKYAVERRGSTAVEALEAAWDLLREIERRIPRAVVTFVDLRSRHRLRGYFAYSIWKKRRGEAHEVAFSPELIGRTKELLATMLHEAAHAVLYESGHKGGMGSTSYYHTKKFRDQCRDLGLECRFRDTRYGWAITHWPAAGVPERYEPLLRFLRDQLPAGTGGWTPAKRKPRDLPPRGHTRLVCGCTEDGRAIYVKKTLLEQGGVLCRFCGKEFALPVSNM